LKILIAEDDDVSRHILKLTLTRWGYEVVSCADGLDAWRALQQNDAPRIAILDWVMPGMDGIEVCRSVREHRPEPYTYVLLLTAKGHKDDVIKGMGAGADDYIPKPFDPQELRMRLGAGCRIIELQAQLLAAQESLRYLATHDGLTGLVNRAEIIERLRREIDRADRETSALGLLLIDIDHFKKINDGLGHTAGDQALVEVAGRMRSALRSYDEIGRYGGEEFLVILPGCDEPAAYRQADRLRSLVAEEPVSLLEGSVQTTVSVGVVAREVGSARDLGSLIRGADEALYRAKAAGRNRVARALGITGDEAARMTEVEPRPDSAPLGPVRN
jgi:two-component system, cell cycle response regulator